jgi:hypothetical protein
MEMAQPKWLSDCPEKDNFNANNAFKCGSILLVPF